ncbi:predicted protein [Phaeodactylum tricornutum CCAP 1055/1]|uniref:Uncharacterized protein n=1 Tax=Phaeodactylum tricornutum (strain CCAP 1055/1) TaxID=556484 RepID=B7G838_PHATC|nr:predicted protein [Phaeodactylum tricornutum CCAP 1055/1]EEC45470.1 predicted protein [Phaeodactylum tricornutum CCAP 1055/1]|eukprot:XP_002183252.1 predicted protein [Phaeodactylum tricornutum CCAP 1055/1]
MKLFKSDNAILLCICLASLKTTNGFSFVFPSVVSRSSAAVSSQSTETASQYRSNRQKYTALYQLDDSEDLSNNLQDDTSDSEIFFDDFADFGLVGQSGNDDLPPAPEHLVPGIDPTKTALHERIQRLQNDERQKDAQLMHNWKRGNWDVRGFSLDPESADLDVMLPNQRVHVCKVALDDNGRVWVGRQDGSVVLVGLGDEYWTHFRSKLAANAQDNDSIKVASKLVREENYGTIPAQDDEEEYEMSSVAEPRKPFEIRNQISAHASPISSLLAVDGYLFTSGQEGTIQQWIVTEDESDKAASLTKVVASRLMDDEVHKDTIVCLKPVSVLPDEDPTVIFSAAKDGSLALWDLHMGELLYKCQIVGDKSAMDKSLLDVSSADSDGVNIYIGTNEGQVLAYTVKALLESASTGRASCPLPNGQWTVTEPGETVTSLACAGKGTLGRGSAQETTVLLTGCASGTVKQFEVFARRMPGTSEKTQSVKLEQWPKMSSQRLRKKAHVFSGHEAPVTALCAVDSTKFLSASADGTIRAWDTSNGKELFAMDGFTSEISSLCFQDALLVTDGMEKFVCVHDFDVDPNGNGDFEIEMDEW